MATFTVAGSSTFVDEATTSMAIFAVVSFTEICSFCASISISSVLFSIIKSLSAIISPLILK
ncbi:MAG: hypothetical protein UH850_11260 [Paludibacteraceae bacterium]|nr:hypothetical protein [Paludibacteraceae bacterium]